MIAHPKLDELPPKDQANVRLLAGADLGMADQLIDLIQKRLATEEARRQENLARYARVMGWS